MASSGMWNKLQFLSVACCISLVASQEAPKGFLRAVPSNSTWVTSPTWNGPHVDDLNKLLGAVPPSKQAGTEYKTVKRSVGPTDYDPRQGQACSQTIKQVRNQGGCGSCWAFSASTVMTDVLCRHTNGATNLQHISPQHMGACSNSNLCAGGWPGDGIRHAINNGIVTGADYNDNLGASSELCYPYEYTGDGENHFNVKPGEAPPCRSDCNTGDGRNWDNDLRFGENRAVELVVIKGEAAGRQFIYDHGSVSMAFEVMSDFYSYRSGVYISKFSPSTINHAVSVIGWGTEKGVKYWLVKNSWGERWGDGGFFKIRRGTNEANCELYPFESIRFKCGESESDVRGSCGIGQVTARVTIRRAEGLNDEDGWKNLSDPYVTVWVDGQTTKFKTDKVKGSLNPSWDREFVFSGLKDCVSTLVFEVHDHDWYNSDDFLGRASTQIPCGQKTIERTLSLGNGNGNLYIQMSIQAN